MKNINIKKVFYTLLLTGNIILVNGCSNKVPKVSIKIENSKIDLEDISDYYFIVINNNYNKYYLVKREFESDTINYYDFKTNELIAQEESGSFEYLYENKIEIISSLGKFIVNHNLKKESYDISELNDMYNIFISERNGKQKGESTIDITDTANIDLYSRINENNEKEYYMFYVFESQDDVDMNKDIFYPSINDPNDFQNLHYEDNLFNYIMEHSDLKKDNYTKEDLINIYNNFVLNKKEKVFKK